MTVTVRVRIAPILLLALGGVIGCARHNPPDIGNGDWSVEVIPRNASALPVGSNVTVELDQPITSGSRPGQTFTMHVTQPVVALDQSIVMPENAVVFGHVAGLEPARDSVTPALLRLDFDSLRFNGRRYPFRAAVVRVAVQTTDNAVLRVPSPEEMRVLPLGQVVRDSTTATAGSRVSLGTAADARLPRGTRLTLRATRKLSL